MQDAGQAVEYFQECIELFLAVADKACKIEEMSATPMDIFVFSIIELVASFRVVCCLV